MRFLWCLIVVLASPCLAAGAALCDPKKMDCVGEGLELCPATLSLWEKQPKDAGVRKAAFAACSLLLVGQCQESIQKFFDDFAGFIPGEQWLRDATMACVTPDDCKNGGGICGKSMIDLDEPTLRTALTDTLLRRLSPKLKPDSRRAAEDLIKRFVSQFPKPAAPGVRTKMQ